MLMRNFSITNLEQSKRLFYAGLKLSTADYIIQHSISKVSGVVDVEETPIKVEMKSDLQKAENNDSFSAAWSLGKLIYMMPILYPLPTMNTKTLCPMNLRCLISLWDRTL